MNREEKLNRIREIEQTIFDIEIGTDYLTDEQCDRIRELQAEKRRLREESDI